MKILLVEDDRLLGVGLTESLQTAGYEVSWCERGGDALRACASEPFSVVILDLGLPDVDGLTVLRRLRRNRQPFPVLILSARNEAVDRVKGLDLGADDYLAKPFDLDELLARVRALLRRQHGQLGQPLQLNNG